MAGHSKWANIQHRKGAQDARRGKLFTKLIREITVSSRTGGGDPINNPRLRAAMDKALTANIVQGHHRARHQEGTSVPGRATDYEEIRYEGYGSGGIAVMVDCLTDNRVRTVAEVRHAFSKAGGNLGTDGSVAYLFTKTGILSYPAGVDEDRLMEVSLEAGADDVISHDDRSVDVLVDPAQYETVRDALVAAGLSPDSAEVTMRASTTVALDEDDAGKMLRLLERLEDLDDVQNVYSNADISEDILAKLG